MTVLPALKRSVNSAIGIVDRVDPVQVLWVASLAVLPLTIARFVRAVLTQDLDPVSEVWAALAYDWHRGEPYRPLFSQVGYGGTRYFPGHMFLQAAAMSFLPVVSSGFAVTALSLIMLFAAGYGLLRTFQLSPFASLGGASLAFMSLTLQQAAVATRGDLLPVSLGITGLWAANLGQTRPLGKMRLAGAGFFFALGWMTKWTSVAAPTAAFVTLWARGQRRSAVALAAVTIGFIASMLSWTQWRTDGRFIDILIAFSNSRFTWLNAIGAPYRMVSLFMVLMQLSIPPTVLAVVSICCFRHPNWARLRALILYFALAGLAALSIYTGFGAEHNHLLELEVIGALLLAGFISYGVAQKQIVILTLVASLLCSANLLLAKQSTGYIGLVPRRTGPPRSARYQSEVLPTLRGVQGPVFSVFPMIPMLMDERPYLLDIWMFAPVVARRPEAETDFRSRLRNRRFGAVVVNQDLSNRAGRDELDRWFVPGTSDLITDNYQLTSSSDELFLFLPRSSRDVRSGSEP